MNIVEEGYLFVYLSYDNDSPNWVYFDDLKITHTKTNVIQYNDYYPFGLLASTSWTRDDNKNNHLYNAGSELNRTSGWYETALRGYDPAIGRFMQIDMMASAYLRYSGYHYALNNPVSVNDPTGAYAESLYPDYPTSSRGPTMRGWNDNSQNGPGSGHYWLDQYLLLGSSPASFINRALNSDFGGSWNNGHGYLFTSSGQAFAAGAAYNFEHDSWGHTYYGDYEASLVGYVALRATGELLSPDAVHTAIKLVRNGVRSFGPAVTCNEPNCTHHMMGPRVEYTQGNGSSGLSTPFVAATTFSATAAAARSTLNVVNQELAKQNLINNMLKKSDLQRTAFSGIKAPGAVKFVGKFGGAGFAVWGAADIDAQYRAGGMSRGQMYVEQISNGIGAIPYMGIGTAWSIGWTLGGQYGPSKWYGSDDTKWFR